MVEETVALLMCVYKGDRLEFVIEATESIFRQSRRPEQIIIVIDGPIDSDLENFLIRTSFEHGEVLIKRLKQNIGFPMALNKGLDLVRSDWVARFDADDIMDEKRIETQMSFIQKGPVDLVGGQIREFDNQNNSWERRVPNSIEGIKKMLPWRNPLNHVTVMYRRELINAYRYRDIPGYEDYDLWYRVLQNPKIILYNIDSILVNVRTGVAMYGRRSGLNYAIREYRFRALTAKYSDNLLIHWFAGFARMLTSLFPKEAKPFIYRWFLRNGVNS